MTEQGIHNLLRVRGMTLAVASALGAAAPLAFRGFGAGRVVAEALRELGLRTGRQARAADTSELSSVTLDPLVLFTTTYSTHGIPPPLQNLRLTPPLLRQRIGLVRVVDSRCEGFLRTDALMPYSIHAFFKLARLSPVACHISSSLRSGAVRSSPVATHPKRAPRPSTRSDSYGFTCRAASRSCAQCARHAGASQGFGASAAGAGSPPDAASSLALLCLGTVSLAPLNLRISAGGFVISLPRTSAGGGVQPAWSK